MRRAALLCAGLLGCVSAKQVTIATNPPGAEVHVDGKFVGRSPAAFTDEPSDGHYYKVQLDLPGYRPKEATLKQDEDKTITVCAGLCPIMQLCLLKARSLPKQAYSWDLEPASGGVQGYPPPSGAQQPYPPPPGSYPPPPPQGSYPPPPPPPPR